MKILYHINSSMREKSLKIIQNHESNIKIALTTITQKNITKQFNTLNQQQLYEKKN